MKFGIGRILGIVGGLLAVIGTVLPWVTISGGSLTSPLTFSGLTAGFGGIGALLFGVLGLIFVAVGKRVLAILAMVWGILALLLTGLSMVGFAAIAALAGGSGVTVTTNYGVYVSLVGSLILIVGSIIAFVEVGKARATPPQMPMSSSPPR